MPLAVTLEDSTLGVRQMSSQWSEWPPCIFLLVVLLLAFLIVKTYTIENPDTSS